MQTAVNRPTKVIVGSIPTPGAKIKLVIVITILVKVTICIQASLKLYFMNFTPRSHRTGF